MKIAAGGIQHETNTFATTPTTLEDFSSVSGCGPEFAGGDVITKLYSGTATIHGGFLDEAEAQQAELLPLLCARAQPAGVVEQSAFERMTELFLSRLEGCLPVDGVVLDLHGAMVTEQYEDAEGEFLARVRALVGSGVPVVATLDLHANITRQMADAADVLIGFKTYPHVDMYDRGREAVRLLCRMVRGEIRPQQAFRQLPLITLPPMQCTLREPMQSLMKGVEELEASSGIVSATVAMGFPFADIADAGVSVLVTADGDRELAEHTADRLAGEVWKLRDRLQPELTTIERVMEFANSQAEGLVIFADGSDNPGGGAPCDGTVALRALIDAGFQGAVVGVLCDPEAVAAAHAAGVGQTIDVAIGGKTDDRHGEPVVTRAYVRTLGDGHFIHRGPMRRGLPGEFGRMAVLVVGGVEVVLAERRIQLLDAEMLRVVGISPERRRLLVVKSAVHFRADLGQLAMQIFDGDTPGVHRPDLGNFDFRRLRRPIYPLDLVEMR